MDDPIFIPIEQLEMNKDGQPAAFSQVIHDMKAGITGQKVIKNARKGIGKVSFMPVWRNDQSEGLVTQSNNVEVF